MTKEEVIDLFASFLKAFGMPGQPIISEAEREARLEWIAVDPESRLAFLGLTPEDARSLGYGEALDRYEQRRPFRREPAPGEAGRVLAIDMQSRPPHAGPCWECKGGNHAACIGVPCSCDCEMWGASPECEVLLD